MQKVLEKIALQPKEDNGIQSSPDRQSRSSSWLRQRRISIAANISSMLLLRIASRISFMLMSFYLGERFASTTAVVCVLEAFYISEFLLAPIIGSLSDRLGRKIFLLLAPVTGAVAAIFLMTGAISSSHTVTHNFNLHLLGVLVLILVGRLIEGATTAINAPASLGYITDLTVGSEKLRTRVLTIFEIATVGGLAIAIPLGGKVSSMFGLWGFFVVMALHALNFLLVAFGVKESVQRVTRTHRHGAMRESLHLLRDKHIFTFLPAWLAINTLVGAWITLFTLVLTYPAPAADLRFPGQLLYGGWSKEMASYMLGGLSLLLLLGMGVWTLIIPRIRRTSAMLIALAGLALCIISLSIINGLADNPTHLSGNTLLIAYGLVPLVMLGVFLLSGFPPAALNQMAAIADERASQRGAVMGLYSVVLGIGQFMGGFAGGVAIDLGGFYGLMIFSALLSLLSLASVLYMRIHKHDMIYTKEAKKI
jgi:MFS family permease